VKGGFEFSRPKTKAGRRDIELSPEAVAVLQLHQKLHLEERLRLGGSHENHNLVFASMRATPIRRQNLHPRPFKPLLKIAGLPHIRFHDLRHSFASIALCRRRQHKHRLQDARTHFREDHPRRLRSPHAGDAGGGAGTPRRDVLLTRCGGIVADGHTSRSYGHEKIFRFAGLLRVAGPGFEPGTP
jgi:hypothetical protein